MAEVTVLTPTGSKKGKVALADDMFGIQPNVPVMHQVVTAQLAARRAGTQSTKTRAEVRGGGRKPYKQKGTGNARQGSIRAPQFSGGGVALGPKPRSYHQRTPKKMVRLALRSALSDRANEGRVVVVNGWDFDTPSTKAAARALDALGIEGTVLVVLGREDETAVKSFRNLPAVQLILVTELNAYDVLTNDWIVFTSATLPGGETVVEDEPAAEKPAKAKEKAEPKADEADTADTDEAPYGAGSHAALDDDSEPDGFAIKGNAQSMLYHVPGSRHYKVTKAEVWFASEDDAEAAGFSKPASQRDEDEEDSE
jgi:large subunit ribosomal protein L4